MIHPGTITIYDYSWDGAYIVMDDAILNRLQNYAKPIPGLSNSIIIAEMLLTLSWTMVFEIVCKRTHDPLQDHTNRRLELRWCSQCHARWYLESFAKVRMTHSRTIKIWNCSRDGAHIVCTVLLEGWNRLQKLGKSPSRTLDIYDYNWDGAYCVMDEEIVCNSWNDPLQDHRNLWLQLKRCLHYRARCY